jgi:class 3 adenylate cyclase
MELPPATSYVSRRGKSLAYQVFGEGPRTLVCFLEISFHLDLLWTDPHWLEQCSRLADGCRVVLLQQMGLGLSDAIDRVPTLEEQASDVAAVMDAEGIESATLFAVWSTCMPVILFAAQAPERVDALVLLVPYAQGLRNEGYEQTAGFTPEEAEALAARFDTTFARWGDGLTIDFWDPVIAPRNRRVFGMLERSAATPVAAEAMYEAAITADVRAALPLVRASTRVLYHPTSTVPEAVPRFVAELIPNATFHQLSRSEPHMSIGEAMAPAFGHLQEMAVGRRQNPAHTRQLASILFTDVVASTQLVAALGDARWRELLARHEGQIRRNVEDEDGQLVNMIGDGSMSIFAGPAAAIRAARSISNEAHELDIKVRAGVHTGECDRRPGGDISGLAVHIAARVGAAAEANEVWVSRTVRDLIGGSGLRLDSRGAHELKGVNEMWELFAVMSEDVKAVTIPHERSRLRPVDRVALATARRAPKILRSANRVANAYSRARRG